MRFFFGAFLSFSVLFISAQETESEPLFMEAEQPESWKEDENFEKITEPALTEKKNPEPLLRDELFLYGTDIDLLRKIPLLIRLKEASYNQAMIQRFSSSTVMGFQKSVIQLLLATQDDSGREAALRWMNSSQLGRPGSLALFRVVADYLLLYDPDSLRQLLPTLIERQIPHISGLAIVYLGKVQAYDQAPFLLELYENPLVFIRDKKRLIVESLGLMGAVESADLMRKIVWNSSESLSMRSAALLALSRLEGDALFPQIQEFYEENHHPMIHQAIAESLGSMNSGESAELLGNLLRHPHKNVRLKAINAVERRQATEFVPALLFRFTEDRDRFVRHAALATLAKIDSIEAEEALDELFLDSTLADIIRYRLFEEVEKNDEERALSLAQRHFSPQRMARPERLTYELAAHYSQKQGDFSLFYDLWLTSPQALLRRLALDGIKRNKLKEHFVYRLQELYDTGRSQFFKSQILRVMPELAVR